METQTSSQSATAFATNALAVALAWAPVCGSAADIEFTTQKAIVFKDGHALIIKKGKGEADAEGEIHTAQVPDAAVLGSFWATAEKPGALLGMRAGWREDSEEESVDDPALDNLAVLRANIGKPCVALMADEEEFEGVIREVLVKQTETTTTPAQPALGATGQAQLYLRSSVSPQPAGDGGSTVTTESATGTHFVLRTEEGDVLLPAASVAALTIPDMATENPRKQVTKTRTKRLSFRFAEPSGEHEITLMYFRPGVRWIPTYRIGLAPEKGAGQLATMSLQAEILNEAEDLVGVPFDIVVGVPNFRFKTTPSPLSLEGVLRNTLVQAEPALMGQSNAFLNTQFQSRHSEVYNPQAAQGGEGTLQLPEELAAEGAQDLFIYSLPELRLRKGDRAAVTIFDAKLPYRDVYTWDVHLTRDDIATAPSGEGVKTPLHLSTNKVWHQIQLTNSTEVPWTTGPALIMQGQQPLAQELLTYTSPKEACRVPVTVSVDVHGSITTKETERKLNAVKWEGYNYAQISSQAALSLRNSKPHPIDIEISVRLGGRVESASDDGEVTLRPFDAGDWRNYRGSGAVNNSSSVRWKVQVGAGERFAPTIDYRFYTRH